MLNDLQSYRAYEILLCCTKGFVRMLCYCKCSFLIYKKISINRVAEFFMHYQ